MPLYRYKCVECEKSLETIRKVEDRDAPLECECGEEMEREVSETGSPRFVGTGWTPRHF